jgi:hypothetical protein
VAAYLWVSPCTLDNIYSFRLLRPIKKIFKMSHWNILLHCPHHPAVVPDAQVAESGSGGLLLVRDSDQRAGWPQLGPEDHLQGLGGGHAGCGTHEDNCVITARIFKL